MAVVIGTNAGFVSTAPTADPDGTGGAATIDGYSRAIQDSSSSGVTTITEVGWYADATHTAGNYEVGLYSDNGTDPYTRLHVQTSNTTSGLEGWQVVTGLSWTISASTAYYIAVQMDAVAGAVYVDYSPMAPAGTGEVASGQTSLTDPWPSSTATYSFYAIYAVETGGGGGTNMQVNIGDVWKSVAGAKINIGDAWKTVASMQINIGDVWKTIF